MVPHRTFSDTSYLPLRDHGWSFRTPLPTTPDTIPPTCLLVPEALPDLVVRSGVLSPKQERTLRIRKDFLVEYVSPSRLTYAKSLISLHTVGLNGRPKTTFASTPCRPLLGCRSLTRLPHRFVTPATRDQTSGDRTLLPLGSVPVPRCPPRVTDFPLDPLETHPSSFPSGTIARLFSLKP